MDTIIVIVIVGLAILCLYRHFAASFKKGATSCSCNGCADCSFGCPQAGDRPKAAGRIIAGFDAQSPPVCGDVKRFQKKKLPHSSKKIMDGQRTAGGHVSLNQKNTKGASRFDRGTEVTAEQYFLFSMCCVRLKRRS